MGNYETDEIKKHLLGLDLIDVDKFNDELKLVFSGDLTLIVTGGYTKEIFTEIMQRKITYEKI
ncbi:hypothetical protein VQL36_19455 [Chengkuizengella sp. SCS-71B]|uniref:hypothetical protein n=1 Tax=Chengkuizengella sp. SCS-71B TaxID=3115290 RepID=UPI0032C23974